MEINFEARVSGFMPNLFVQIQPNMLRIRNPKHFPMFFDSNGRRITKEELVNFSKKRIDPYWMQSKENEISMRSQVFDKQFPKEVVRKESWADLSENPSANDSS